MSIYFISIVGVQHCKILCRRTKTEFPFSFPTPRKETAWTTESQKVKQHTQVVSSQKKSWRSTVTTNQSYWVKCVMYVTGYPQPPKITDSYYNHQRCWLIVEVKLFYLIEPFTGASVCSVCPAGAYTNKPGDEQQQSMKWWILYTFQNQHACMTENEAANIY